MTVKGQPYVVPHFDCSGSVVPSWPLVTKIACFQSANTCISTFYVSWFVITLVTNPLGTVWMEVEVEGRIPPPPPHPLPPPTDGLLRQTTYVCRLVLPLLQFWCKKKLSSWKTKEEVTHKHLETPYGGWENVCLTYISCDCMKTTHDSEN